MKFFVLFTTILPVVLGAALPEPEALAAPGLIEGEQSSWHESVESRCAIGISALMSY